MAIAITKHQSAAGWQSADFSDEPAIVADSASLLDTPAPVVSVVRVQGATRTDVSTQFTDEAGHAHVLTGSPEDGVNFWLKARAAATEQYATDSRAGGLTYEISVEVTLSNGETAVRSGTLTITRDGNV